MPTSEQGRHCIQDASGTDLPPNDAFFGFSPSLEYDSFITVGGLTSTDVGNGVQVDGNGINFTPSGFDSNSGWFALTSTGLGIPVFNAQFNLYTVTLGQFTISGVSNSTVLAATGDYTLGWNDGAGVAHITDSAILQGVEGVGWQPVFPTPSSGLIILAGLGLSSRRRRS